MAFQGFKTVISAFRTRAPWQPKVYDAARKAKQLLQQNDKQAAGTILEGALEQYPGHSSLEDMRHFLGQDRLRENLSELRGVVEEARKAYVRTARAFADTENTQKAIEFIMGAFKRFPECPELHLILGEIYLRRFLEDMIPEDGRQACACLERACALDAGNSPARRYLAGFYARIGCFHHAADYLSVLDGKGADEEENRYLRELTAYCLKHAEGTQDEDLARRLNAAWEAREFAVDCRDWAWPRPPVFSRSDMRVVMVPFIALEVTARKCVQLPGVEAVVVQNDVRSETTRAEGVELDVDALENVVREIAASSADACHRMELGHVKHCDVKTTAGRISLHMFADTWAALLFKNGVSAAQVATVTQQFLDLVAERLGEIHEINS